MVHQHFMLVPVMTVAENIVLAQRTAREGVFFDREAAEKRVDRRFPRPSSSRSTRGEHVQNSGSASSSGSRF